MGIHTFSSRDFARDVSAAKRAAADGPVIERGQSKSLRHQKFFPVAPVEQKDDGGPRIAAQQLGIGGAVQRRYGKAKPLQPVQPAHGLCRFQQHGARAIDRSLPVGAHGLPLMGTGDWNDGMNRVGSEGRGESVWLAWFLCVIVSDWLPLARARGERDRARAWEAALAGWRVALGSEAWDGAWFKRAFFDDGSALGSSTQAEARIDLIAQAWSVLSDQTSPERQRQAMDAVEAQLVDPAHGLIRLLHPPLQHAQPSAGYIQAYPPGVRENGGQYAHAGVWALMAAAALAQREPGNSFARNNCIAN